MENSIQPKEIEVIKAYIERAKKTLEDAKSSIDGHSLLNAQNRIYYACFYIVKRLVFWIILLHQSIKDYWIGLIKNMCILKRFFQKNY